MARWHMSSETYGMPDYGIGQSQDNQFVRGPGDLGQGQYRTANPTGPLPLNLTWTWTGTQLQTFREEWEIGSSLFFGAAWFTMDLPIMLADSDAGAATTDYVESPMLFQVLVGFDNVDIYGYRGIPESFTTGDMVPRNLLGHYISQLRVSDTFLRVEFDPIAGPIAPNDLSIPIEFPDAGEADVVTRADNTTYYTRNLTNMPTLHDYFVANVGLEIPVLIKPSVPMTRTYPVHFMEPFRATMRGYDTWTVTARVEVDVSPQMQFVTVNA